MTTQRANQRRLKKAIIMASEGNTWDDARTEWELESVFIEEDSECACGHTIAENCKIRNKINNETLVVGNECIKHFECRQLKVNSNVFEGLRRIACGAKANKALLDLCIFLKVLPLCEVQKYKSISRRPIPTQKQLNAIQSMNKLMKQRFSGGKRHA